MVNLPVEAVVIAVAIVFVGGLVHGLTGFGFALVVAPVLLLILQPRSVVALILFVGAFLGVTLTLQSLRHISLSKVALLFVASVPGSLMGMYVARWLEPGSLRILICLVVVATAIPLYLGHSHRFRRETMASAVAGVVSGVLSTTTSLHGPPVVLFLVNQGWAKDVLRATMATYLMASGFVAMGLLAADGVYGSGLILLGAGLVPAGLVGYALGSRLVPRVPGESFKKIVIIVVAVSGLSVGSRELWNVIASRMGF